MLRRLLNMPRFSTELVQPYGSAGASAKNEMDDAINFEGSLQASRRGPPCLGNARHACTDRRRYNHENVRVSLMQNSLSKICNQARGDKYPHESGGFAKPCMQSTLCRV